MGETSAMAIDDESLACRARAGDSSAMEQLVRKWQVPLMRFLERRVGRRGDAEDLFQETFVRVVRGLDRYDEYRAFKTWIFTIAWRLAANHLRDRHDMAGEESMEHVAESAIGPAIEVERTEERESLWGIARRVLSAEQYHWLWLCYAEGFAPREIAKITGRNAIVIKTALHRARRKLEPHVRERIQL